MKVLITVPYDGYFVPIEELILRIYNRNSKDRICYISLHKTYPYLKTLLGKIIQNKKRFLVVDAASRVFNPDDKFKDSKLCTYLNPPNIIKGLEDIQKRLLDDGEFKYIIFDSLSSLLVYHDKKDVNEYINNLANKSRLSFANIYFLCSKSYLPDVLKKLESSGVLVAQEHENEYLMQFKWDPLLEIYWKLEEKLSLKDKDKSLSLYEEGRELYNKMKKDEIEGDLIRLIHKKFIDSLNKIKLL
ncbi:hypothetical protein GOV14_01930 [Candidatus Pacearchaeota archaeon]|nr:hypothetical protein [Candidatus Pacearchaeota archaeon]